MKLRFTRTAARQLDRILEGLAAQSPQGARNVQARIQAATQLLHQYPNAGQMTSRQGIRRIVVSPYLYLIIYRIGDGEVVIRTLRHAARKPIV